MSGGACTRNKISQWITSNPNLKNHNIGLKELAMLADLKYLRRPALLLNRFRLFEDPS
jgi:hypothetical protein